MRPVHPFTVRHRDVFSIAVPATFAFITEPLAGLTDLTVIGRLGDANLLGGLVLGVLAFNFIGALFFFLRIGTGGLVAQSVGAREPHEGLIHFARATILGTGAGIVLIVLGAPIIALTKILLGPEPAVIPPFETYLGIRLWSAPLTLVNFALLGWFYGRAKATTGMLLQFTIHGCNIVFSIGFVYGLGWGIAGVALGTVLAEAIAAAIGLFLVLRHAGGFAALRAALPRAALVDGQAMTRLFALSRDLVIRSIALDGTFAFFTAQMAREGAVALSANAILLNFAMVTAYFLDGQAQAAEQLCGKAVGANYRPAFDRAMHLATGWGLAIGAVLVLALVAAGPFAIDFMTTAPEIRAAAREHLFIAALVALTGVHAFVMDGVIIGATLNHVIRNGIVVAALIFLALALVLQPLLGLIGLWLALHGFFISRGVFYWLAVRAKRGALFAEQ